MRSVLLGLLLLSSSALAAQGTVSVGGMTYRTGLLPRPAGMATPYFNVNTNGTKGDLPESFDARDHGLVSPIKDQGNCGSCWAFARAKAFEAALLQAGRGTAESLDLAEQDTLVNDTTAYGCEGGFMDGAFEVDTGVTTEDLCPYRANDGYSCSATKYGQATRWAMLGTSSRAPTVTELRKALVDYGVLAVTVAAGGSFSPNADGRITTCGTTGINHMVTLVGYRPAPNGGYEFLIGNSWGTSWGDGGYAWSKQGCNELASVAGDAALFFTVDPQF